MSVSYTGHHDISETTSIQVPYRPSLEGQISIAYDAYLELTYLVDDALKTALRRDTPNWHLLNACPSCFYQLGEDPDFEFSFLCEMDGNNSLKRTTGIIHRADERTDKRTARSDYWICPEDVDQFKDEVQSRAVSCIRITSATIVLCHSRQTIFIRLKRMCQVQVLLPNAFNDGVMQDLTLRSECLTYSTRPAYFWLLVAMVSF